MWEFHHPFRPHLSNFEIIFDHKSIPSNKEVVFNLSPVIKSYLTRYPNNNSYSFSSNEINKDSEINFKNLDRKILSCLFLGLNFHVLDKNRVQLQLISNFLQIEPLTVFLLKIDDEIRTFQTAFSQSSEIIELSFLEETVFSMKETNFDYILNTLSEKVDHFGNSTVCKILFNFYLSRPTKRELFYSLLDRLETVRINDFLKSNSMNDSRVNSEVISLNQYLMKKESNINNRNDKNKDQELLQIIQNDDYEQFVEISNSIDFDVNKKIETKFQSTLLPNTCSLINCAAFYGSEKIFGHLLLNKASSKSDVAKFAIAGGNAEIIHKIEFELPNVSFDGTLKYAICYHHHEIFEYLMETKNQKMDDYHLVENVLFFSSFKTLQYIIDQINDFQYLTELAFDFGYLLIVKFFARFDNIMKPFINGICECKRNKNVLINSTSNLQNDVVLFLISLCKENAEKVLYRTENKSAQNLLHISCSKNNFNLLKLIVNKLKENEKNENSTKEENKESENNESLRKEETKIEYEKSEEKNLGEDEIGKNKPENKHGLEDKTNDSNREADSETKQQTDEQDSEKENKQENENEPAKEPVLTSDFKQDDKSEPVQMNSFKDFVNKLDNNEETPLKTACAFLAPESIEFLLSLDEVDLNISEPILDLISQNSYDLTELFLNDPRFDITSVPMIIDYAISTSSSLKIVELIMKSDKINSQIVMNAMYSIINNLDMFGDLEPIREMFQKVDLAYQDINGNTFLHRVCQQCRSDQLFELIKMIVSIDSKCINIKNFDKPVGQKPFALLSSNCTKEVMEQVTESRDFLLSHPDLALDESDVDSMIQVSNIKPVVEKKKRNSMDIQFIGDEEEEEEEEEEDIYEVGNIKDAVKSKRFHDSEAESVDSYSDHPILRDEDIPGTFLVPVDERTLKRFGIKNRNRIDVDLDDEEEDLSEEEEEEDSTENDDSSDDDGRRKRKRRSDKVNLNLATVVVVSDSDEERRRRRKKEKSDDDDDALSLSDDDVENDKKNDYSDDENDVMELNDNENNKDVITLSDDDDTIEDDDTINDDSKNSSEVDHNDSNLSSGHENYSGYDSQNNFSDDE